MITVDVRWNKPALQRVRAVMKAKGKKARSARVTVGLHPREGGKRKSNYAGKKGAATLAFVMLAHEFGAGVPERSWFRSWFDRDRARHMEEMIVAERAEYQGRKGAVDNLAIKWWRELREHVIGNEGNLQALADTTKKARQRQGLDDGPPLAATYEFVNAIRAMVDGRYVK